MKMKKPSKKPAELLTNLDGKLSPEEQKFGENLPRYYDGKLSLLSQRLHFKVE